MTCEEAMLLMNGHLDHENTAEEEAQLREHLQTCEACRSLLRVLEGNDEALRSLQEETPADLCSNVMASIRQERQPTRRSWKRWGGLAVAAALVLVVGLAALPRHQAAAGEVMAARTMEEAPVAYSRSTFGMTRSYEQQIQGLAEDRQASIVVAFEILPELEQLEGEDLSGDTVLYPLENAAAAQMLSDSYGLPLYTPDAETALGYALLIP